MSESNRPLAVGDVIHGFAYGAFGRDHFYCARVEAVGRDWVVVRSSLGTVEFSTFLDLVQQARDEVCPNGKYNCEPGES
ncbi:hypothetical protein ACIBCT_35200 [Streptosporangium sp. NPDC050855]|uniref:hypothetical protein n=1 Tax=Streptosporangium sp. NPDC050855 TaxID=3366194 RepID=UPI0037AC04D6